MIIYGVRGAGRRKTLAFYSVRGGRAAQNLVIYRPQGSRTHKHTNPVHTNTQTPYTQAHKSRTHKNTNPEGGRGGKILI